MDLRAQTWSMFDAVLPLKSLRMHRMCIQQARWQARRRWEELIQAGRRREELRQEELRQAAIDWKVKYGALADTSLDFPIPREGDKLPWVREAIEEAVIIWEKIHELELTAEKKLERLVELEKAAWGWSAYHLPSNKRGWARLTIRFDGALDGRTRLRIYLCYLRKARLSKLRNRLGNADHVQICSDYGALSQSVWRSYAETEEPVQILKSPCNSYDELGSKELICESKSPAPRSQRVSECNSGQRKEDDLMTRFAPTLEQRLHDAIESILGPVAYELRRQGEEARKERWKLVALEKQKLALKLKELQRLKHRRAGRFQRSRRASSALPRRRRQGQGHCLRNLPRTPNN